MADKSVVLRWLGEGDRFEGSAPGGPVSALDGSGTVAPSPMDGLLLSVAGCMGIDILMILQKGRVTVDDLEIQVDGERAAEPPRHFTSLDFTIRVTGPAEADDAKIQRAVDLSRDRYCSVFHSLRPDLDVRFVVERG